MFVEGIIYIKILCWRDNIYENIALLFEYRKNVLKKTVIIYDVKPRRRGNVFKAAVFSKLNDVWEVLFLKCSSL